MTTLADINSGYIPKNEFDWEYYLSQNEDIKKAGIGNLDAAYRHWIIYGCYENRWVKSSKSEKEMRIKLKPSEKFLFRAAPMMPSIQAVTPPGPTDLGFKIAIMIHVFDVTMFPFFTFYLNHLSQSYSNSNFDIYINIVEENSPFKGDLKKAVADYSRNIVNPNVTYFFNENRGGDIGGFLLLSKYIIDLEVDYKYAIFVHSKTRLQWRKELCQSIFNIQFENLSKIPNLGLIGCKKWLYTFDPKNQIDEYRRFKYHLVDLCEIYELGCDKPWQFIAGTMFLANIDIIKYIVNHRIDETYVKLNKPDSVDVNWLTIVTDELKKDPKGAGNDLQYRLKYGKPLHPDYMIEHTYERIIGLICQHLQLKVIGQ
jgi:hypothetical protein